MNGAVVAALYSSLPLSNKVFDVLLSSVCNLLTRLASRGERLARKLLYLGCENRWKSLISYNALYLGLLPSVASYLAPERKSGMLHNDDRMVREQNDGNLWH